MDKVIKEFLEDRKKDLNEFCLDFMEQSKYIKLVTHNPKYVNSKIKTKINVKAILDYQPDGYVRSGNNGEIEFDAILSAAFLPNVKFLELQLVDGATVLDHFFKNTDYVKKEFSNIEFNYDKFRSAVLSVLEVDEPEETDTLVKQVYFPIEDNCYHLLSILNSGSNIFKLKNKIDDMIFSDEAEQVRAAKKDNIYSDLEGHRISNCLEIGYGGDHLENVGFLCNKNHGTSYLLPCFPPSIEIRNTRLPHSDFFKEILYVGTFSVDFDFFYKYLKTNYNNKNIRNWGKEIILNFFDKVVQKIYAIREYSIGWSDKEYYSNLPINQKILLDAGYECYRKDSDVWLEEFIMNLSKWFVISFNNYSEKSKNLLIGDSELEFLMEIINEEKGVLL